MTKETNTRPTSRDVHLDVLVIQKANAFVAQCLQHDIAVQGANLGQARVRFAEALAMHVLHDLENKREPLSSVPQAPARFWKMYMLEEVSRRDLPIFVPSNNGAQWGATFTVVPEAAVAEYAREAA